ncbi:hypothetical protein [Thiobacter aerophilum]|uniref:DNA-binding protein n=1 Tax=Thiobacter aerophilum TaxID=3121275 RepID=A0ABV0EDL6_9BURK
MERERKPLGDATAVRGKLALAGYRSINEWANAHGVKPVTARRVIYDWANRADREPHGGIARQVMKMLRETLEAKDDQAA